MNWIFEVKENIQDKIAVCESFIYLCNSQMKL